MLAAALDQKNNVPLMIIATGRADVLHGLLDCGPLASMTETFSLQQMSLDQVPRIVDGPAEVVGLAVEPRLPDRITRDLESAEALPLLAYTLSLLYERCKHDRRLTLAAYFALGDTASGLNPVQNSVRRAAEEAIQAVNPSDDQFKALRDAFVPHLVRLRLDDAKRLRQPARQADLPIGAAPLIDALTKARLLTTREKDGYPIVEVAHELLFDAWPMLAGWLREEHAFLADLELLKNAFQVWREAPDIDKRLALLRGLLLSRASTWLELYQAQFNSAELRPLRSYVETSRRVEDWGKWRKRAMAAAFVAFICGGLVWVSRGWIREHSYEVGNATPLGPTQEHAYSAKGGSFRECTDCPEMIVVPAGSFTMGSADGQGFADEHPEHKVTIPMPLAVAKFELTIDQWQACVLHGDCAQHDFDIDLDHSLLPMTGASWDDVKHYVAWLARITGKEYRLLTEAEYEYSARAGTTTVYPWGDKIGTDNANCTDCGSQWGKKVTPVNSFAANQFGIFDMIGNVWEWVEDCYHTNYSGAPDNGTAWLAGADCSVRVVRGGSWGDAPSLLRSANRGNNGPGGGGYPFAIRVCRTLTVR